MLAKILSFTAPPPTQKPQAYKGLGAMLWGAKEQDNEGSGTSKRGRGNKTKVCGQGLPVVGVKLYC